MNTDSDMDTNSYIHTSTSLPDKDCGETVWRPLLPTGTVVPYFDVDDSNVEALLHKLLQDGIGPGHVDVDVGDVHVDSVVALQEEGGTSSSRPTT